MPALDQYEKAVFCNISIFLCIFFRRALILLFCISQWIDEYDYDYGDDENDDDESNEKMILIVIMVMMRTMTMIVILIILTVLRGKMLSQLQNSFFLLNRNSVPFSNLKYCELITTIIIFKTEKVFVKFSAQNELKLQSGPVLKQSSNKFVWA